MKIKNGTRRIQQPTKMQVLYAAKDQFGHGADVGQNWDTVMTLVTFFEMILTGFKRETLFLHLTLEFTLFCF